MNFRLLMVLAFALCMPPLVASSSVPMKSIDEFLEDNSGATNGSSEVFVGLRCHALHTIFVQYFENSSGSDPIGSDKEKSLVEMIERLKQSSAGALNFALENRNKATGEFIIGQSKIMVESYADAFVTAKARTGSGVDDPVIQADLKTCGEIFAAGNR